MKTDSKSLKKYRANLRTWAKRATKEQWIEGVLWYSEAQNVAHSLADTYGVTAEVAAGVISALSPNNKWDRNKLDAATVLAAVETGTPATSVKVCTYNANKAKAFDIAMGNRKVLKQSPKTYAFAQNVGNLSPDHVTIDKWHLRAMQTASRSYTDAKTSVTPKQYRILEQETVKIAKEFGLSGYEFQAIVWVTIRDAWMNN